MRIIKNKNKKYIEKSKFKIRNKKITKMTINHYYKKYFLSYKV